MIDWLFGRERRLERIESLVVYTAILGTIPDRLARPPRHPRDARLRFVCFTDRPDAFPDAAGWEFHPPAWTHSDARRAARRHKVLSHVLFPDAAATIWHDGNIRLRVDPRRIVDRQLREHDVAALRHSQRTCVYEELEACIELEKDAVELMRPQVDRYRAEGYPAGHGLSWTGVVARRHSAAVRSMNEAWWREIENGSLRDQLSFNVVMWRLGIVPSIMPGSVRRSPYLKYTRHR